MALNVGRAVYFDTKEALSYYAYERVLVLLSRCGVSIGTLNHSRKFAAEFVVSLEAAMVNLTALYLDTPAPELGGRKRAVAFCADKSTELRRQGQVLGAICMVRCSAEL